MPSIVNGAKFKSEFEACVLVKTCQSKQNDVLQVY